MEFHSKKPIIVSGFRGNWVMSRMVMSVLINVIKTYKKPKEIFKIFKGALSLKNRYNREHKYHNKLAFVDGRYFVNCNNSGWPSKHFNRIVELESRQQLYNDVSNLENLRMVQFAFTKKCPLNCVHCYEGEELNKKDVLNLSDKKRIVGKLQNAGIPMIHFGGGDPMAKVDEVVELLESAKPTSDFWVFTSGFNLTAQNAKRLKSAGLTGISIGLDYHDRELHNKFRRNEKAFDWAMDGAENAVNANLVLTFTVCLTRDFCTEENLMKYMELARSKNASFVQMLEPRAVGNFAGKDVFLLPEQSAIVDEFFLRINRDSKYKDMPIILYPGYHQKRGGCTAAGIKYLYIDTNGYMSSCPFCRNTKTHILDGDHEINIESMKIEGCGMEKELNKNEQIIELLEMEQST